MGITRIGSRDIQKALKKWGSAIESDVTRIVYETARIIEAEAKALAPVDEGHLRDSIEMQITGEYSAVVHVGAHYAVDICRLHW
ncbi:HK97 gp10 family phage protein [Solibacillus silvestris]